MLIPYSTEVLIQKWPVSNLLIIGACTLSFILMIAGVYSDTFLISLILCGWNPLGLFGHMFLHAGLWHLVFNMLYLWVFGNAVCEKIGNIAYAGMFLLSGICAAVVHNLFDDAPAIGASGAINGVIGFYLILYPINAINCFWWFFLRAGTFEIAGFWIILFWFAVDAWHAFSGANTGVAYWAHVGGFASGAGMGVLALKLGLAKMSDYDNPTLLDYLFKKKEPTISRKPSIPPKEPPHFKANRSLPPPAPHRAKQDPPPALPQEINLDCPHCSQNLDVPGDMAGTLFSCPACGGQIQLQIE